jgi:methyl-accepting chemotaxis protein
VENLYIQENSYKGATMKINLKNQGISTKLVGGFLTILLLLIGLGTVSYFNMKTIDAGGVFIFEHGLVPVKQLDFMDRTLATMRGDLYKYIISPYERKPLKASIENGKALFSKQMEDYGATLGDGEEDIDKNQYFTELKANWEQYMTSVDSIMTYADDGMEERSMNSISVGGTDSKALKALTTQITNLQDSELKEVEDIRLENQATFTKSLYIMLGVAALAIVLALITVFLLLKGIIGPINKVKKALQKMANGDLTEQVNIKSSDEVGAMAKAYNESQRNLNDLMVQFKQSAVQLSAASDQLAQAAKQSGEATQQVASSSGQMAKGAQEQSTNAQETTKSVSQLSDVIAQLAKGAAEQSAGVQKAVSSISSVSQTISEVAESANQVAQGAKQATESANAGAEKTRMTLAGIENIRQAASDTAKKIEELGARSAEIGKIVAVIDDIAAQTNLLALNAAIEAARAGEQGRGFAVVSDEVRKLAERSATATKEIAELIGSIQKGIDEANKVMAGGSAAVVEGCNLAKQAGAALEDILKANSNVNSQIEQISTKTNQINAATIDLVKIIDSVGSITEENTAATEQMSSNAVQVSKAVETVAGIAEENSAATEQVSASAEEMSAQIEEIVASSQTMKEMAAALEKSVDRFKVK